MNYLKPFILSLLSVCSFAALQGGDGVTCPRCDDIRAYNAAHPQKSEYYEDYLKEHGGQASAAPAEQPAPAPAAKAAAK